MSFLSAPLSLSEQGFIFLRSREGFRPRVYRDQAGYGTIGYGHKLAQGEEWPDGITEAFAEELLAKDVKEPEDAILGAVTVALTQPQFDALVSLVYNIGNERFARSRLLVYLNDGNMSAAADEFSKWDKIGMNGALEPSAGLARRRREERGIFLSGEYPPE